MSQKKACSRKSRLQLLNNRQPTTMPTRSEEFSGLSVALTTPSWVKITKVRTISADRLRDAVLRSKLPVLVDFYAPPSASWVSWW